MTSANLILCSARIDKNFVICVCCNLHNIRKKKDEIRISCSWLSIPEQHGMYFLRTPTRIHFLQQGTAPWLLWFVWTTLPVSDLSLAKPAASRRSCFSDWKCSDWGRWIEDLGCNWETKWILTFSTEFTHKPDVLNWFAQTMEKARGKRTIGGSVNNCRVGGGGDFKGLGWFVPGFWNFPKYADCLLCFNCLMFWKTSEFQLDAGRAAAVRARQPTWQRSQESTELEICMCSFLQPDHLCVDTERQSHAAVLVMPCGSRSVTFGRNSLLCCQWLSDITEAEGRVWGWGQGVEETLSVLTQIR